MSSKHLLSARRPALNLILMALVGLLVSSTLGCMKQAHQLGNAVVATEVLDADPLRIKLTNPPAHNSGSGTEQAGRSATIFLGPLEGGVASLLVFPGASDETVVMDHTGGMSNSELYRSEPGVRDANGDLVLEVPAALLDQGPYRLWTAHSVETRVNGTVLSNQRAGSPLPVIVIE